MQPSGGCSRQCRLRLYSSHRVVQQEPRPDQGDPPRPSRHIPFAQLHEEYLIHQIVVEEGGNDVRVIVSPPTMRKKHPPTTSLGKLASVLTGGGGGGGGPLSLSRDRSFVPRPHTPPGGGVAIVMYADDADHHPTGGGEGNVPRPS